MKNVKYLAFVLLSVFLMNLSVDAVESNATVKITDHWECSAFQDDAMSTAGDAYFGRCMKSTCQNNKWNVTYDSPEKNFSCTNGNTNPYTKLTKSACPTNGSSCNTKQINYCTTVTYFDCSRTANGSKFTTTTRRTYSNTTTTTTAKVEEPTTTVPVLNNNTNLSNITLSTGTIQFNSAVREYSIEVEATISAINVVGTPEVSTSKVAVQGNTNLVAGNNKITITVTAEDGSTGTYIINVNRKSSASNNAKLSTLTVEGHDFVFNSDTYSYVVKTKAKSLVINATTQDPDAIYMIEGNNNLKNNSTVKVVVTAEDKKTMQEYTLTIKSPSSSAGIITVIFVVVLVIAVGGGVFYFYTKRKNGGEKEYEYE